MVKLNNKRIKYIIDQRRNNIRTAKELSQIYNITTRHIQSLVKKYKETKTYPVMNKARRPSTELTKKEKDLIIKCMLESKHCGAVTLRLYMIKYHNVKISKNKLHNYLREIGVSKPDKKKQKQRKYCRYERDHSFSLGHMDYHESRYDGSWTIVWIDDASRIILAGREYKEADTNKAKEIVERAIKKARENYSSVLRELNTDKGTQFFNAKYNKDGNRSFGEFENFLVEKGIKHIPSKRNHPQTNGKNERWFRTYEENRAKFKSFDEFIKWYNDRIHLGLSRTKGITPNEIVWNRLQPEAMLGLFWRRFE